MCANEFKKEKNDKPFCANAILRMNIDPGMETCPANSIVEE